MKTFFFCLLTLLTCCSHLSPKDRSLFIYNAKIYTLNPAQPMAEAVVVENGRIVFVGKKEQALPFVSGDFQKINLKGQALYPGFVDAHAHLSGIGFREMSLNLSSVKNISELRDKLKENMKNVAPGQWVQGMGWIETHWPEKRFPNRYDIDGVSGENPVLLARADGHGALANSKALQLAGINKETPDPKGGKIQRDKTGEPTGLLIDKAIYLVANLIPEPSQDDLEKALVRGARRSAAKGWVGLHDSSGTWEEYKTIESLMGAHKIPIRVYNSITATTPGAEKLLELGPQKKFDGQLVTRSLKVFADGALGSRGAALIQAYSDQPKSHGLMLIDENKFMELQTKAIQSQIQIRTHAIGDRANRKVLDWFEKATEKLSQQERKQLRWRVEHAQVLHPNDLPRLGKLGLIASMQPSHAIGDLHFAPSRLGNKRLRGAYAWRSLLDSGVLIAGGSDAPVEEGDPLIEFYAAVARKDKRGFSGPGWNLQEKVTRQEALKMFTLWAAFAAFEEMERGSIEVGKYADFTVFSGDLMKVPLSEILKLEPRLTVVQGKVVYNSVNKLNPK